MPHFFAPLDMHLGEVRNMRTQNLSVAPAATALQGGLRYYDTTMNRERYWTGTAWITIDNTWTPPTGDIDLGGFKIINLGTPTAATDAATKGYVDSVATGLDVKDSVRAASTTNVTVSGPGATIDGVTLAAGDRVLLKNQTTASQNGIYVWNGAAVAMTRAPDANVSSEVTNGLFVFVTSGTANTATGWILTTPDPIVLDTTNLTFSQMSASTVYIGTANRITVTGNQIDIAATYVGQTSITTVGTIGTGTWQGTAVGLAYGGTGATTAAGARTNLGVPGKYTTTITGDGVATQFTITHNLGTKMVSPAVYENATENQIFTDVVRLSTTQIRLDFGSAPANAAAYDVVVVG